MFVNTIFCMIPPHFKQKTTTSQKIIEVAIKCISVMTEMIGIGLSDSRFIGKRAWMTRKISAESWKVAVFEIPLSPWAFLEYFTQGNSLINSGLYPRKSISLSYWVVGLPLKYINTLFLILIRGYSITQGKPFSYIIYI